MEYFTENGNKYEPQLCVGDSIEFDYFGQLKSGRIITVGKFGYWIANTCGAVGNGSLRCPFGKERKL